MQVKWETFQLLQNFWATCAVRADSLQFCFLGQAPINGIFEWVIIALNQVYRVLKNKTEPPKKQHSVLLWTRSYGEQENYKNQMENKQILTKLCTNQNFA